MELGHSWSLEAVLKSSFNVTERFLVLVLFKEPWARYSLHLCLDAKAVTCFGNHLSHTILGSYIGWPQRPHVLVCETEAVHLQQTEAMTVMFNCSSAAFRDCTLSFRGKWVWPKKRWESKLIRCDQTIWTVGLQQPGGPGIINVMVMLPLEVRGGGGKGWRSG